MSHGLKLLMIAAGAIITCIVVVVGFQLTKSGKNDTNKASEQYTSVIGSFDDVKLTIHEDMEVSGADVVTFIKENAGAVAGGQIDSITVKTNMSGLSKSYNSSEYNEKKDKIKDDVDTIQSETQNVNYINPSGTFECTISRNSNGMIQTIRFEQI